MVRAQGCPPEPEAAGQLSKAGTRRLCRCSTRAQEGESTNSRACVLASKPGPTIILPPNCNDATTCQPALDSTHLVQVIVKDSNVVCVAEAAACLGSLAKSLRKDFTNTARAMFPNLLDKLKDKNTAVCAQSAQALIDFHRCDQQPLPHQISQRGLQTQ